MLDSMKEGLGFRLQGFEDFSRPPRDSYSFDRQLSDLHEALKQPVLLQRLMFRYETPEADRRQSYVAIPEELVLSDE